MKWILWKGFNLGADQKSKGIATLKVKVRCTMIKLWALSTEACLLSDHPSLDDHSSCWDAGKVWEMTGANYVARSFRGNWGSEAWVYQWLGLVYILFSWKTFAGTQDL